MLIWVATGMAVIIVVYGAVYAQLAAAGDTVTDKDAETVKSALKQSANSKNDAAWNSVGYYELVLDDIAGISYTPQCLGRCNKPVNITYKAATAVTTKGIKESILKQSGGFTVLRSGVDELINTTYYTYSMAKDKCENKTTEQKAIKNATHDIAAKNVTTESCTYKQASVPHWRWSWQPFKDKTFKAGEWHVLNYWVDRKPELGPSKVDLVISVNDVALSKATWWNSTWTVRRPVINGIITDTWTNGTQYLTLDWANFTTLQSNCNDLRVTDTVGNELAYSWVNKTSTVIGCGTKNMTIMVRQAVTANNMFYVYSGNPSAPDGSSDPWSPEVIAVWPLMGDRNDKSGYGNNLTIFSGSLAYNPLSPDSKHMSAHFSSTQLDSAVAIAPAKVTVGVWYYPKAATNGMIIGDNCLGAANRRGINIGGWNADNKLSGGAITSGTEYCNIVSSTAALTMNAWNFIGIRVDGTYAHLIINGVLDASDACVGDITWAGAGTVHVGDYCNAGSGNPANGYMMNMVILDRDLNQSEIYALMNATKPSFVSNLLNETSVPPPPRWTGASVTPASPQTYGLPAISFNVSWTPDATNAWVQHNGTGAYVNYSMTNTSGAWRYQFNLPAVGTIRYTFTANSTYGSNSTAAYDYVITHAASGIVLTSSNGWSIVQGTGTSVSCSATSGGVALYRDGAPVANPYSAVYPNIGNFVFLCNLTGDAANYTPISTTNTLTTTMAGLWIQVNDEVTTARLTFNITLENGTSTVQYTNVNSLFINTTNSSWLPGQNTLTVSTADYGQRTYVFTNDPYVYRNVTAWLVQTGTGSFVRFHTLTITEQSVAGTRVEIYKNIGGSYRLIGSQLTDASGTAMFFLNPLTSYMVNALKTGWSMSTPNITITPSQADYKIYMISTTGYANITSEFYGINVLFTPPSGGLENVSTFFNFTVTSASCSLLSFWWNMTLNGTSISNSSSSAPCGGSITNTTDLTNWAGTVLNVTLCFRADTTYCYHYGYYIWRRGYGLIDILAKAKDDICPAPIAKGTLLWPVYWCPPLNFIAIIICFVVAAVTTTRFSFNGGGMASAATLWCFVYVGWWPWQAAMVLTLGMLGIMIMRGGTGG